MTDPRSSELDKELQREREDLQESLDKMLEDTIRQKWLPNTAVWLGVTLGAFALNLLILLVVAG